uniref:Homoserine O-acetyltransferase n=1 Tax=uncultured Nocardioidaceae bacterium TaxID=253824 RepID=A0A6J4KW74_9ACTN|nr:MAG: Homoserine O-acetyltransferase [uncultured Nocardioidaceae bacterium]
MRGAWRPGDPPAARRFVDVGPLSLELGGALEQVTVAYETWGVPRLSSEGRVTNAVLVLHALTGDAHVVGPAGPGQPTPGWWQGLIGPGAAIDSDRWFVVAANVLGGCQGTTGPSSLAPDGRPYGSRFGRVTIRDQVEVEARLADALSIDRFACVLGGSMGGMRALEWVVTHPGRVRSALVLATSARASAEQIATQSIQTLAVKADPNWCGGDYLAAGTNPVTGLGVARRIAQLTYRSELELQSRFGAEPQTGEDPLRDGRFAVQSYLDHHANKLAQRFDAGSYVVLSDAMSTHDVGRGRGGAAAAMAASAVPSVVAGIDTDRLYPLWQQEELAARLPGCNGLDVVESAHGHDGFLIEADGVGRLVGKALAAAPPE